VAAALEGAAAEHTLHVVDLAQPERPVVRGGMAWRWPVGGIEWTGRPGVAVAVAKGRLATIDLRDPDRPRLMAEIEVDTEGRSGRLAVRGDLVLVHSWFGDGVDIVSVADPQRPRIVDRLPVTQERWARSVVATWLGERVVVVRDQELVLFEPAGIGGGGMPGAGEVAYEPVGRWRLSETELDTRWAGVVAFGDDLLLAGEAGMYVLRLDADEGDAVGGDGEAQEPRGVLVHRQHVALPAGGVPRTDGRTVVVAAGDGGMHVWRALAPRGAVRIVLPWLGAQ